MARAPKSPTAFLRSFAIARSHRALGVVVSLVVHASAALAAMLLDVPLHGVRVDWQRTAGSSVPVQLVATSHGPEQPLERTEPPAEPTVLITPERAEVARRVFVLASSVEPPQPEVPDRVPVRPPTARIPPPAAPVPGPVRPQGERSPPAVVNAQLGSGGETPPRLVRNAPPVYPPEAVVNRWEGTVLLRLSITAQGHVGAVEVLRSSGHPALDGAAASAVRHWLFEPATRNGQGIASTVRLPVRFALR